MLYTIERAGGGIPQISDLVVSEYQQAHALLYDELLFQAKDLTPMESWRLKDDLDLEDFGGSWLSHLSINACFRNSWACAS